MPRIFLSNFDFEHELAGGVTGREDRRLAEINRSLSICWGPLIGEGDLIVNVAAGGTLEFLDARTMLPTVQRPTKTDWKLVPWGWSESAREIALNLGLQIDVPNPEIVRRVNRRSFRFELEREFEIGPVDSVLIRSEADLRQAIQAYSSGDRWVVKAEFGMSGRERIVGRGSVLTEAVGNWLARQLQSGGVLVFEPWLNAIREAGLLYEIPRESSPKFIGVAELLTDSGGTYLGSRFGHSSDALGWEEAIEMGLRVSQRLQEAGYFGPLGIDVMEYDTPDGVRKIRMLQDLNARLTMGRLALAWRDRITQNECAVWLHLKRRRGDESPKLHPDWPADAQIVGESSGNQKSDVIANLSWYCIEAASPASRLVAERLTLMK
ncbi:MAG: hypothetical protein KDA68_09205 [Planctomycetaceae bacterium]|nr:hypothetical protein [Planctomycetaceae bacterium]